MLIFSGLQFSFLNSVVIFFFSDVPETLSIIVNCNFVTVEKQLASAQIKEHRGAVLDLIEMYLKGDFLYLLFVHDHLMLHLKSLHPYLRPQNLAFIPCFSLQSALRSMQALL